MGRAGSRRARPFSVTALERARRRVTKAAMRRLAFPLACGALALAGCNSSTEGADPGPVTQEEAEALDDAASMLEEQRLPEEAADQPDAAKGETE